MAIRLQSSDGKVFDTDERIVKCSGTIKAMLGDCTLDEGEEAVVPLPNVNSVVLSKILEWANFHKDDPQLEVNEQTHNQQRMDEISSWDADFVKVERIILFELILAANYLDIKELLELTTKTVANMIMGKSSDEIRQTFGIKNDFTAMEEEKAHMEDK